MALQIVEKCLKDSFYYSKAFDHIKVAHCLREELLLEFLNIKQGN